MNGVSIRIPVSALHTGKHRYMIF